ncbi:MAG: hypothetical protein EXR77_03580 [Myxococcales bacterium]|nr:hypothetical protein [Myxococcales bacterium]
MGFLANVELGDRGDLVRAKVAKAMPGLEIAAYWQAIAESTTDSQRRLLSYMVSALLARGWMQPLERVLESAEQTLGESPEDLKRDCDALVAFDLLTVDGSKVTGLAGLISTKPTGLVFKFGGQTEVALLGPLAALAVGRALQKNGEVRAVCAEDRTTKLLLKCDNQGVEDRDPNEICAFFPAWDGESSPTHATASAVLLRDDEALGRWQEKAGEPDGMPLSALFFPMAAADLAMQVGAALETVLNHLPDFD